MGALAQKNKRWVAIFAVLLLAGFVGLAFHGLAHLAEHEIGHEEENCPVCFLAKALMVFAAVLFGLGAAFSSLRFLRPSFFFSPKFFISELSKRGPPVFA